MAQTALPPLTHHQILALVAPFSRSGRYVDLAASDRMARQVAFRPVAHGSITETLQLDNPAEGRFRLSRVLALQGGLQARLTAEGSEPAALLARVDAVPVALQHGSGSGYVLAKSHRLESTGGSGGDALILTEASALVGSVGDGLLLKLAVSSVRGISGEMQSAAPRRPPAGPARRPAGRGGLGLGAAHQARRRLGHAAAAARRRCGAQPRRRNQARTRRAAPGADPGRAARAVPRQAGRGTLARGDAHRGTRAVRRMVEHAPATGGLALWMQHMDVQGGADRSGPPVSTNGVQVRYAAHFDSLPLAQQTGWVAHEVLHIALRHPQRFLDLQALIGDVDLALFNTCADAIVNRTLAHLAWLQLPDDGPRLDTLLLSALGAQQTIESALLQWDVESLYRAVDDRHPGNGRGQEDSRQKQQPDRRQDGPRAARVRALGGPEHADLQPDAETRGAPEAEAEATREWSERVLRSHAGDGDFSMLRTLLADLPRVRTPWQQVLRIQLARALTPKLSVSWSRPARSYIANQGRNAAGHRMPWEPGFSMAQRVPRLAVVVDVSGSVEDSLMERFAREIEAITRRLKAGLVLVVGDDRVRAVAHFKPGQSDLRQVVSEGGGGTDFSPLLQEADQHLPDIGVVLTDLQGPAAYRPRWPVVWAVPPAHAAAVAPYGRKLVLD